MLRAVGGGLLGALLASAVVRADDKPLRPPVVEDWSDVSRITKDNDWSAVPGFQGHRGDKLAGKPGVNPQTIAADGVTTPVDVIANQKNPNSLRTGGVAEFDGISNPTIALKGSGTASAPFLLLNLDTRGKHNITIGYKLRDLDASANNATQPIALQYRTQLDAPFTDIPGAFVPDASSGPNQATLITPIVVILPARPTTGRWCSCAGSRPTRMAMTSGSALTTSRSSATTCPRRSPPRATSREPSPVILSRSVQSNLSGTP